MAKKLPPDEPVDEPVEDPENDSPLEEFLIEQSDKLMEGDEEIVLPPIQISYLLSTCQRDMCLFVKS